MHRIIFDRIEAEHLLLFPETIFILIPCYLALIQQSTGISRPFTNDVSLYLKNLSCITQDKAASSLNMDQVVEM